MGSLLGTPEEVEVQAQAARDAINARLATLPDGELHTYWSAVAKIYARGMPASEIEPVVEPPTMVAA